MSTSSLTRIGGWLFLLALVASACAVAEPIESISTASPPVQPTAIAEPTTTPPTPVPQAPEAAPVVPTAEPAADLDPLQRVNDATLKVLVRGSRVPIGETRATEGASVGTAFFINEDGLAVTNSHVVAGASSVEVFLNGSNDPTPARVLGISECSDLALLDVDGDGYTSLTFRMDPIRAGLRIFAAGFPVLFDEDIDTIDYTLTAGIVNTTTGQGETGWASVPNVIEHDARIRGGNSGGPLVDEQGNVVGVNFANEDTNDLNLAISSIDASALIDELQVGDFESLGIDPDALPQGQGMWVSSVRSGSEADRLGILAGDVITEMDGVQLARDGTAEEYCAAVRSADSGRAVDIVVERPSTGETLRGEVNGSPLFAAMAMSDEEPPGADTTSSGAGDTYEAFRFISDETATLSLEVPVEFTDISSGAETEGNARLQAAPDGDAFQADWQAPGLIVRFEASLATEDLDVIMDLVEDQLPCETDGERDEVDGGPDFTGAFQWFFDCEGVPSSVVHVVLQGNDGERIVRLIVQVPEERDLDALIHAVNTLDIQFRDDAVITALVDSTLLVDNPLTADEQEARCIAIGVHDEIGADRLTAAGIIDGRLLAAADLTRQEDERAVEVIFRCVDVESLFVAQFEDAGITREDAECVVDEIGVNDFKEAFVDVYQDPALQEGILSDEIVVATEACGV